MKVFSRLTLSTRVTLLALLALVPLFALVILSDLDKRDTRREAGYTEARAFTQNAVTALNSFGRDIDSYMTAAAVVIGGDPLGIDQANTGPYLLSLITRYENLTSLFITDLEGRVVVSHRGTNLGLDLSSRPYIVALMKGQDTVWTGGLTGVATGEVVSAYGRTIKNSENETVGYLVSAFRPSNLSEALGPSFPKDANFLLVDQDGQVIFSAKEPDLKPGEKFLNDSPQVEAALNGETVEFHRTETNFDEGERFGVVAPIPTMKWVVGYTRSQAILDASLRDSLLRDIGFAGLFVLISIAGLLLLSRAITSPLRTLSAAATEMAFGRVAVLPKPSLMSDPDVAGLERAFSTMASEVRDREGRLVEQARTLGTLEQMGAWIASGLEFEKTSQAVTDAGTRVTEAQFGAFFYNVTDATGESYQLYALSGVEREHFDRFPMPRNTAIFAPTFRGDGPIRSDDITKDPRYGNNAPYAGMPEGHVPVHSYLAVPVISATGESIGGLFFGHEKVGVFGERHERLASGIAAWAGIALDNARLYSAAQMIQEELRKSNQSKDEFLGVISHELRTPVTTIYGGLRLLEGRFNQLTGEDALDLIGSMAEEGGRLVRLIENLLAFARLELGRPVDTQPVAVAPLARHVIEAFNRQRPGRRVEANLSEDLPPLELEPTYFEQVLQNLISNADKYSPPDKSIHVDAVEVDGELRVLVSDYGPGVSDEEIDVIFEGFYRSDRTSGQATGHGLGLTVCKRLVETQGGRIWARNLERGGLEVGFAFPTVPIEELVTR